MTVQDLTQIKNAPNLISELRKLCSNLAGMDQETADKHGLNSVKEQLVHSKLMNHKDKGVKILVACCLSDILRLYAPEPPFDQPTLRSIFALFFKQLSGIHDVNGAYFSDCYYLLDSICTVRSVTLLSDLNADILMTNIVKEFFEQISYLMIIQSRYIACCYRLHVGNTPTIN
jgi:sister-chromatid-cohesion protein PDS5